MDIAVFENNFFFSKLNNPVPLFTSHLRFVKMYLEQENVFWNDRDY